MTTYAFNDVAWGAGTTVNVTRVDGLDMPPVRSADSPLPGGDGVIGGIDLLDARSIEFEAVVREADRASLFATLQSLAGALGRRSDDLPLTFQVDPSLPMMRINCRPRRRNIPMPNPNLGGYVPAVFQLVANDPLVYSDAEHVHDSGAATMAGGFSFPFSFPFSFGVAATGGVFTVVNAGTAPAPWIAIIQGPCVGVTIANGFGELVHWNGTLTAEETLTIDSHPTRHTAVIAGTASRFGLLASNAVWFDLQAGENEIHFATDNGQGTLLFTWRDAWWSVT
jgi:Phage tail protein